jgi:hypothetical protein
VKIANMEIMDTSVKNSTSKLYFGVQNIEKKTIGNKYELEVVLEEKMYPKMYYNH